MRLILFSIGFFFCSILHAQKEKLNLDTSTVEVRTINIDVYKKQKDFQYNIPKPSRESLWNLFWRWFWQMIDEIRKTKTGRYTLNTLLIITAISAIVFFIVKVTGMNAAGIFGRNESALNYTVGSEDINSIDFKSLIDNAIDNANYVLAVRLLYLQSLKFLTDKNVVNWKINKTNTDYIKELNIYPYQSKFILLTNVFDNVWYGNKDLDKEKFEEVYQLFKQFQKAVDCEEL